MHTIQLLLRLLAAVTGGLALLAGLPLFFAFRWPAAVFWGLKIMVSALSPLLALVGLLIALVGWTTGAPFITLLGLAVAAIYILHFIRITRPPASATGFEQAFGPGWENHISPGNKKRFLSTRMALRLPAVPPPRLQQNVSFATVPGTNRSLLCDLWQPSQEVTPSGLAFIYLHGSAFYFLDKDFGTRPFFSHLAAQGHVIMDVAYRMAPETDIMGMVHDVMRAIAWIREQANRLGVDPSRIVIGGGSAGGHLALLTAYAFTDPAFIPADLAGKDLSVCAVISLYGTSDLEALYYHTNQHRTTRPLPDKAKKAVPTKMPKWLVKTIGKDVHRLGLDKSLQNIGTLPPLLGGHPDECPEKYAFLSPIAHVHASCPPTLLVHGAHDIMSPVASARRLYVRLTEAHVPTVLHILPQSDHGFDLAFPRLAPAAHNAIYDVERFMALMTMKEPVIKSQPSVVNKEFLH